MNVSVCMATFNGARFLRSQIDSILRQLSVGDELIISDDGSTDGTLAIVNSYGDSRIRLLEHNRVAELRRAEKSTSFGSAARNFENSLYFATGSLIFLSDQDDIWPQDRVSKVKLALECSDLVMCNFSIIDSADRVVAGAGFDRNPLSRSFLVNVFRSKFLGCCMTFRKEVLEYCLPFPLHVVAHDYWIGCMVSALGSVSFLQEPLHQYRRHENNVSSATGKSGNSLLFKIQYRLVTLTQILRRILSGR